MTTLKCKMCGGKLEITEETSVCECEYCGSKQTIPTTDDEKIVKLYDRANHLRMDNEFDKAAGVYESIIAESESEAEAYWGLLLCKYGIEYVDDPATANKVPTCHRSSFDSIIENYDLKMVMENADSISRNVYREQAKQIEEIRKKIIEVSGKEAPYDIFICYKETTEDGNRTIDSILAQNVYEQLTAKGYRVFFSRITLADKLGQEYEPYIFAALNSARIMLVFGTDYDYYNAVWVKNEWSRYMKLMVKDKDKHLIPCYKDINVYDIPKELKYFQAQDMGKVGAEQDLLRGIDKILGLERSISATKTTAFANQQDIQTAVASAMVSNMNSNVGALLERGFLTLEDGDFTKADRLFEGVLNQNPRCAEAYMGKLMAYYKVENAKIFAKKIFNSFFPKVEIKKIEIDYDIQKLIDKYYILSDEISEETMWSIKNSIKTSLHTNIETNIDSLNQYDEANDYIKEYCTLDNHADDGSEQADKFYQRYLQYATEENKKRFNVHKLLKDIVVSAKEVEEKNLQEIHNKCSKENVVKIIESANEKVKSFIGDELEQIESEYQLKLSISDCQGECDVIKQKYEQIKKEVDENNQRVKQMYQEGVSQYERELVKIDNQLRSLYSELVGLKGLFKGKQREKVQNNITIMENKKSRLKKPVIADYGILMLSPRSALQAQLMKKEINQEVDAEGILYDEFDKEDIVLGSRIVELGLYKGKRSVILGSYKGSPISWIMLEERDGKALLLSKYALDAIPYNKKLEDTTWEQCTLRSWLNNDFLSEALEAEKYRICTTRVSTDVYPAYHTKAVRDTDDKIFLLSKEEVEKYLSVDVKTCYPTEYAKTTNLLIYSGEYKYSGSCPWWLRSSGNDSSYAATVDMDSVTYGEKVDVGENGIRPALWINGLFKDKQRKENVVQGRQIAIVDFYEGRGIVKLGSYKGSPISWIMLEERDGKALLLSRYALDAIPYTNSSKKTTWEQCTLRSWLNNDFLSEALEVERYRICTTRVSTDVYPAYHTKVVRDTDDKIFLLSKEEVKKYFSNDYEKRCYPTEYAKTTTLWVLKDEDACGYYGTCSWWLRSPVNYGKSAAGVGQGGHVDAYTINSDNVAVRPALWINLES